LRTVVVDASVAAKWVLNETDAESARQLFSGSILLAPDLLWAELGSLLWRRHRIGEFSAADAREMVSDLRALPVQSFRLHPLLPLAMEISLVLDHSVYDCIYLALCESENCPLVTADQRLRRAVADSLFSSSVMGLDQISRSPGGA
jgi:predicted nucleic acid-binding protein